MAGILRVRICTNTFIASARHRHQAGFSLVELMISSILIVLSAIGSAGLFMISNRQARSSRINQESQAAINIDIAAVLSANDRYSCASSDGSEGSCDIKSNPPDAKHYFPYPCNNSEDCKFWDLCWSISDVDGRLATDVASKINAIPKPANFTQFKITRTAIAEPISDSKPNHRYTVTWSTVNGVQLRQLTLVPTAAAWCPGPAKRDL